MVQREERDFLLPRSRQARLAARQNRTRDRDSDELHPEDLLGFNPYDKGEADNAVGS